MAVYEFGREFGDAIHNDPPAFNIGHIGEYADLAVEIEAAFPGKEFRVECSGEVLYIHTAEDWSAEEQATLATLIADHKAVEDGLEANRATKIGNIDLKTQYLLSLGYSHDAHQFSLSVTAQLKLLGLRTAVLTGDLVDPDDYPVIFACLNETEYNIAVEADLQAMFAAAFLRVKTACGEGAVLKDSCLNAANQAALDAIVDDRT